MHDPVTFDGPSRTLFLIDAGTLRILDDEGGEVLLPIGDLIGLLLHLSVHRVRTLTCLRAHQAQRLASLLRERYQNG